MKNTEFVQKLKEIGWIDNIAFNKWQYDNLEEAQQEILSNYAEPENNAGLLGLTEECFDEHDLYNFPSILNTLKNLSKGDFHDSDIAYLSKLNKNYVEAIASQWKMSNINNVKDAMIQAEKEYKKLNEYKNKKENNLNISKPVEKLPNWYGKSVEKAQMNSEDIKELKDLLSEFE